MTKDIFGRSWEEIQDMQHRRHRPKAVDLSVPGKKPPTDEDLALLKEHGSIEALEAVGLHGVADRLKG